MRILALDGATRSDYPGGIATSHAPLTKTTATPTSTRNGWGSFARDELVGMTWCDADLEQQSAEIDFTVVAPHWRKKGIAKAMKAAMLLALAATGITTVRTGGSLRNTAIKKDKRGARVSDR